MSGKEEPSQVQQDSTKDPGKGSRKPWCKAKSSPTRFQRRFRRGSGEGLGGFEGPGENSGESLGGFGAKPGQVQQGFWRKFREASVQSQVRFNRVRKTVPEKVWEAFGAEVGQVQQGGSRKRFRGRSWYRARSSSTGFRRRFRRRFQEALVQSQVGEGLGGFGVEPGQIQQGSEEGSGQRSGRLRCRAR